MTKYLVAKDEDGILRPMAGCWVDDEYGQQMASRWLGKKGNEDCGPDYFIGDINQDHDQLGNDSALNPIDS